jgi:hypothetical protein
MMPLPSQFSLSLELNKILPTAIVAGTAQELYEYARNTQNSGSDFVTERELNDLLGRVLIDEQFASTFKSLIRKSSRVTTLTSSWLLREGAGPLVLQAFKSGASLGSLPMVVQCSFLCALHGESSLAAAIVRRYQRLESSRLEGSEPGKIAFYPDEEKIRCVLAACRDQTSIYDWSQLCFHVADRLDFVREESDLSRRIPDRSLALQAIEATLFQGLIEYLPFVSRCPEDYTVDILGNSGEIGTCAIVVWAHYILGLAVKVWSHEKREYVLFEHKRKKRQDPSLRILSGHDADLSDCEAFSKRPSIVLYKTTDKSYEEMFKIIPHDEDVRLEALELTAIRGYGALVFTEAGSDGEEGNATIELSLMTCGQALLLLDSIQYEGAVGSSPIIETSINAVGSDNAARRRFLDAVTLLFDFDSSKIPYFSLDSMIQRKQAIPSELNLAPRTICQFINGKVSDSEDRGYLWQQFKIKIRYLTQVLLALFHVVDLSLCKDLQIAKALQQPFRASITIQTESQHKPAVVPDIWLASMMHLLHPKSRENKKTALLSERGWSPFVNTFGLLDPSELTTGGICIRRGVPECDGFVKHRVDDIDTDYHAWSDRGALARSTSPTDFSQCLVRTSFG